MERPIAQFSKNSREVVCFQISEYKGKRYADVRVYFRDSDTGDLKPTRKGITLSPELWPEFRVALDKLEAMLAAQHLVDPEEVAAIRELEE